MANKTAQIVAVLVAPNRQISEQFLRSTAKSRAFEIAAELTAYPTAQALESKVRQTRAEVVLLDVATNLDTAADLIRAAAALQPAVHVIGLHTHNDSEAILRSLRFGACEFLYAPFEVSIQEAAITRIQKLLQPETASEREHGKVVAFASVKPGSGATTLAVQTAYALRRSTGRRVLLADLDLLAGTAGFYVKVQHDYSILDILQHEGRIDADLWSSATVDADGVDVLPAPELPYADPCDQQRVSEILQYARGAYDWAIVDMPTIFHRLSLMTASEADRTFLVSTPELASLHLASRAVKLMTQLGVETSKFQVLINRRDDRTELNTNDLSKLFGCKVDTSLPEDRLGIQRVVTLGCPIDSDSSLGKAIDGLAGKLKAIVPDEMRERTGWGRLAPTLG